MHTGMIFSCAHGDEAVRGGGLERALRRGGAGEVDLPEDVLLTGGKVEVAPLQPQRLAPADAQIAEIRQEQALRVGADRLQHAPGSAPCARSPWKPWGG